MTRVLAIVAVVFLVSGCEQPSTASVEEPAVATTSVAFNTEGAPTVEYNVPDMMCPDGCGAKVKSILAEQPGAKDVKIDFENKLAIVAVEDEFDAQKALAALVDHQFGQTSIKDGAAGGSNETAVQ